MNDQTHPITPSPQAITGALSIYVEGGRRDDIRQVLRHATEKQIAIAMPLVGASQDMTRVGIREMLAGRNEVR